MTKGDFCGKKEHPTLYHSRLTEDPLLDDQFEFLLYVVYAEFLLYVAYTEVLIYVVYALLSKTLLSVRDV